MFSLSVQPVWSGKAPWEILEMEHFPIYWDKKDFGKKEIIFKYKTCGFTQPHSISTFLLGTSFLRSRPPPYGGRSKDILLYYTNLSKRTDAFICSSTAVIVRGFSENNQTSKTIPKEYFSFHVLLWSYNMYHGISLQTHNMLLYQETFVMFSQAIF